LSVILQARPSGKPAAVGAAAVSPNIFGIQLLRAIAAVVVTAAHVHYDFIEHLSLTGFLPDFLAWGSAGVDLFFVISGFVDGLFVGEAVLAKAGRPLSFWRAGLPASFRSIG